MKKKVLVPALVLTLAVSAGSAFAASFSSPAQIIADLTSQPEDQVIEQRLEGQTYGQIASEAGVLEQFKDSMVSYKLQVIEQRVEEGTLTAEQAEAIKVAMQERAEACTGTPSADRERLGQQMGGGLRLGGGQGQGRGMRLQNGSGQGMQRRGGNRFGK